MFINGVIAVALGYLIGSIPVAYLVTFTRTGRSIRNIGDGSHTTSNVFREVGLGTAAVIALLNTAKGATSIFLILSVMPVTLPWILAAGLAVTAGHIWPVFLKFRGGHGLATSIGIMALILPQGILIALAIAILLMVMIRNPVLAVNLSLLSVPVTTALLTESSVLDALPQEHMLLIIFPVVLGLIMALNFLPTAKAALKSAGSWEKLMAELLRSEQPKKVRRNEKPGNKR